MDLIQCSENYKTKSQKFEKIANECQKLLNHDFAKNYKIYLQERISNELIEKFQWGFLPQDLNLDILNLDLNKYLNLGLFYFKNQSENDFYIFKPQSILNNHNLVVPYRDLYGNILGFVGRSILTDEKRKSLNISKYKNTSIPKKLHLFGLNHAKKSILENGYVILVEGQFDALQCYNFDFNNTVAIGCSSLSDFHISLLLRYSKNIVLCLDPNKAGQLGTEKIIKKYDNLAHFHQLFLPDGFQDIDDFLKKDKNAKKYLLNEIYSCIS
jgi:DNA primase